MKSGEKDNDGKWKKGQSGNPKGRAPSGFTLTDILKDKLNKEEFVERMIEYATQNPKIAEMIWNRMDGKVPDKIEAQEDINITFVNKTKGGK